MPRWTHASGVAWLLQKTTTSRENGLARRLSIASDGVAAVSMSDPIALREYEETRHAEGDERGGKRVSKKMATSTNVSNLCFIQSSRHAASKACWAEGIWIPIDLGHGDGVAGQL